MVTTRRSLAWISSSATSGARCADRNSDRNDTTEVIARFTGKDWTQSGDVYTVSYTLPRLDRRCLSFVIRGTNTQDAEPAMDPPGEKIRSPAGPALGV